MNQVSKKIANCFGCNIEKDIDALEVYPFQEEDWLTDQPIAPLFNLDCQGPQIPNDPNNYCEFRIVVVCHSCFHKLSPDMWIGKSCWEGINPVIPYDKLPMYEADLRHCLLLKPLP